MPSAEKNPPRAPRGARHTSRVISATSQQRAGTFISTFPSPYLYIYISGIAVPVRAPLSQWDCGWSGCATINTLTVPHARCQGRLNQHSISDFIVFHWRKTTYLEVHTSVLLLTSKSKCAYSERGRRAGGEGGKGSKVKEEEDDERTEKQNPGAVRMPAVIPRPSPTLSA